MNEQTLTPEQIDAQEYEQREQRANSKAWKTALLLSGLPFLCALPNIAREGRVGLIMLGLNLIIHVVAFFWFRSLFRNTYLLLDNPRVPEKKRRTLKRIAIVIAVMALGLSMVRLLPPRALRVSVQRVAPMAQAHFQASPGQIADGQPYIPEGGTQERILYTFRYAAEGAPRTGYRGLYRYLYQLDGSWCLEIEYPSMAAYESMLSSENVE